MNTGFPAATLVPAALKPQPCFPFGMMLHAGRCRTGSLERKSFEVKAKPRTDTETLRFKQSSPDIIAYLRT